MGLQVRSIEGDQILTHYFLCNYIPQSKGSDKLSKSLLGFKKGLYPHKQAWIDCSFSELTERIKLSGYLIFRALGSEEPPLMETPLDELARRLADSSKTQYDNSPLVKTRVVPPVKQLKRLAREKALKDVYTFTHPRKIPTGILILDDILTTGTTLKSIAKAVEHVLPFIPITLFTMAFTDYHEHPNEDINLATNAYTWEKDNGWTISAEEDEFYNPPIEILKRLILTDTIGLA